MESSENTSQPTEQDEDLERYGRYRVPRSEPLIPDLESGTERRGLKPGSRRYRTVRARERRFEEVEPGEFRVTEQGQRPISTGEAILRGFKRIVVGTPLASSETEEQKISKTKALAVFSSDALSSSAYATDEILLVLIAAGTGALTQSVPIAFAIGLLLVIVTFSYRQTIRAYPSGGGAYIVARENLGDTAGLSAAAALSVDYILTVSVSVAAGVFAIASAFPEVHDFAVPMAIGVVVFVTLANLRGIRESSTLFAIPTYGFIAAFSLLLVGGFIRIILDPDLQAPVPESAVAPGTAALTPFLLMRAFSSGSAALTGVEAISNGIPAFRKPESRNAATTLVIMALILGAFFIGLTILANQLGVRHADEISVPAQIAKTVFGESIIFYAIQAATALILLLAANTSYADFPRLGSILGKDKFLPHQFTFRGDRLAFSHGIIVLGLAACLLLGIFQADVDRLIPLYAFGVFASFTLSQSGMVVHWRTLKDPGWKQSMIINGVGAFATGVVAVIVGATKFIDGAWISMAMMAILAIMFSRIHRHYERVSQQLEVDEEPVVSRPPPGAPAATADGFRGRPVILPVDEVNQATLRALEYARTISDRVTAVHITDEMEAGERMREAWEAVAPDAPLVPVESPYRSFITPMVNYIDEVDRVDPGSYITVVLPEYIPAHFWEGILHNQSAIHLKNALRQRPNTIIISVPYHLEP